MNRKERFLYSDEQTKAELATGDNSCPVVVVSPQSWNILKSFLGSILERREWKSPLKILRPKKGREIAQFLHLKLKHCAALRQRLV